jgi:ribosomal protein L11 methyltransferase
VSVILLADARIAEDLSDALLEQGALSVSVEDADAGTVAEAPLYGEPGMPARGAWSRSQVRALCEPGADVAKLVAGACAQAGLAPRPAYRTEIVGDQDWVRLTQSQFAPIRISERLWIVPSWATAPDPLAVNLVLDPGLAFGTGSHPTTRLCLEWLEAHIHAGERILDYGCGSGILAIAALRIGAAAALGVDVDPLALAAARENAARNRVDARFIDSETAFDFQADLVAANILANPLILLAPLLAARCRPDGRIALSGILESQAGEVMAAYAPWFDIRIWRRHEDWVLLDGIRFGSGTQA